jgi:NAD(P)-dependent dehydrogenase (short-subunit alcohol dehydrogenase family)
MTESVVVVTGALTGIGEATARAFARRGDVVVISGRHDDVGEQLARDLKNAGAADALFVRADVRFDREVADLVDATVKSFGRLDIAVNNAGTEGRLAPIVELTPPQYNDVFGTNVLGTLLSMKHELRLMQRQGSGAIVNVTSIHGDKGFPKSALYVASQHAIIGLTRTAALEAAPFGVRVNAVGPGCVDTAMFARVVGSPENQAAATRSIPQGRAGHPDEVADAITFLSSCQAVHLTGQSLFLDGGVTAG